MADSLGAVLAGINNGVGNGLDIYKTLRDDERFKREERRLEARQVIEDERYAQRLAIDESRYADGEADEDSARELAAKNRVEDLAINAQARKDDLAFRARSERDAERRFQIQLEAQKQSTAAAQNKANIAAAKNLATSDAAHLTTLGKQAVGPNAVRNVFQSVNADPQQRAALARALGFDGDVSNLMLAPTSDGAGFVIGQRDKDGNVTSFDPDGDGPETARTYQTAVLMGKLAGGNAQGDVNAGVTATHLGQAIEGAATEVDRRRQAVSTAAVGAATKGLALAQNAAASLDTSPLGRERAAWEADQAAKAKAVANDPVAVARASRFGGDPTHLAQAFPKEAEYQSARAALGNAVGVQQSELNGARAIGENATTAREQTLQDSEAARTAALNLPTGEKESAVDRLAQFAPGDMWMAAQFPNKTPPEAAQLHNEEVTKFVKDIAGTVGGAMPGKAGEEGKPLAGVNMGGTAEAAIQASLGSMPPRELHVLMSNPEGRALALTTAKGAIESGKPESLPFHMRAIAAELDSSRVVAAMQDPSLVGQPDNVRYAKAEAAIRMMNSGKAVSLEVALAKVGRSGSPSMGDAR